MPDGASVSPGVGNIQPFYESLYSLMIAKSVKLSWSMRRLISRESSMQFSYITDVCVHLHLCICIQFYRWFCIPSRSLESSCTRICCFVIISFNCRLISQSTVVFGITFSQRQDSKTDPDQDDADS